MAAFADESRLTPEWCHSAAEQPAPAGRIVCEGIYDQTPRRGAGGTAPDSAPPAICGKNQARGPLQAQPKMVQRFLEAQATQLAAGAGPTPAQVRFTLPDQVGHGSAPRPRRAAPRPGC